MGLGRTVTSSATGEGHGTQASYAACMLLWGLIALGALVLIAVGFAARRRSMTNTEPGAVDDAELEREFAAAEAYQEEWREQDKERYHEERFP
jgi:hypothetical protein